jgi:tetratricopeptide (TPR) repeat protein
MAVMIHCIVEFNMQIAAEAITAMILMALLAAQERFVTEGYWRNPGRLGKILLTVMALAAMGWLSVQGLHKGAQTYWLARARASANRPDAAVGFATEAIEAEPTDWETTYTMGEYLWSLSLMHGPDHLERVKQAFKWYAKAMQLNPFDAYAPIGCGMCLDALGRIQDATPYFAAAHRKDPHNCYIALEEARHCIELGDLATARLWMHDAIRIEGTPAAYAEYYKLERYLADPLYKPPK